MTALTRLAMPFALLVVAGCATAPSATPPFPAVPLAGSAGLVIGTLSYQYVDVAARQADPAWVVHFDRIDTSAPQDYALVVDVDPATRSGVFTGTLPAGVYAFREAASADRRFPAGALKMPFEVQAGEVRDAGHYALNPILRSP